MRTRTIIYEYSNVDTYVSASDEYFTLSDQSGAECWENLDEGSFLPISYQGVPIRAWDTDASDNGFGWAWKYVHGSIRQVITLPIWLELSYHILKARWTITV